jgi:hypothetical protein
VFSPLNLHQAILIKVLLEIFPITGEFKNLPVVWMEMRQDNVTNNILLQIFVIFMDLQKHKLFSSALSILNPNFQIPPLCFLSHRSL